MSARSDSAGYVLDEQVGYVLRLASQRHAALFQEAAPDGLTPTQFAALVRLAETGPASQNQLGRLTAMDVATIKGVVDRLRRKGLVSVTADPDDKRRMRVALSPQGAALVDRLHAIGHGVTEATLAPLSVAERKTFMRLLGKLT